MAAWLFFFFPSTLVVGGCFSGALQNPPVLQELSSSYGVGPQTFESQCCIYFGAGEEVMGGVTEWA